MRGRPGAKCGPSNRVQAMICRKFLPLLQPPSLHQPPKPHARGAGRPCSDNLHKAALSGASSPARCAPPRRALGLASRSTLLSSLPPRRGWPARRGAGARSRSRASALRREAHGRAQASPLAGENSAPPQPPALATHVLQLAPPLPRPSITAAKRLRAAADAHVCALPPPCPRLPYGAAASSARRQRSDGTETVAARTGSRVAPGARLAPASARCTTVFDSLLRRCHELSRPKRVLLQLWQFVLPKPFDL